MHAVIESILQSLYLLYNLTNKVNNQSVFTYFVPKTFQKISCIIIIINFANTIYSVDRYFMRNLVNQINNPINRT